MSVELQMLAWSIALGIVHLLVNAGFMTAQRGLRWNAGARDGTPEPLTGVAARMERAWRNFLETFALFAAAVLAVQAAGRGSDETALGAHLYFWARLVYVPVYAAGIPYLRSAVWAVALWGLQKLLWALF
ncbi:MAPEG family protein [Lysobacter sp. BMK333-48F3]|uniref:MAPEG family protein n=1 Tax=Lysobacter sp. BMK333-48F3 TaxID=2867962 RepID=UPI001C8BE9FE|nr:MAPEG family protein [Lysobacter sp. BMK333-48F3]MBX9402162.1 MAPEG family protein [Lysobacter sp. BMK333-48F3]